MRLVHRLDLAVRRETFALIVDVADSRVASVVTQLDLAGRALLAQALAGICVCSRLPCLGLQRCHSLVNARHVLLHLIGALRATFASLQLLYPVLSGVC